MKWISSVPVAAAGPVGEGGHVDVGVARGEVLEAGEVADRRIQPDVKYLPGAPGISKPK